MAGPGLLRTWASDSLGVLTQITPGMTWPRSGRRPRHGEKSVADLMGTLDERIERIAARGISGPVAEKLAAAQCPDMAGPSSRFTAPPPSRPWPSWARNLPAAAQRPAPRHHLDRGPLRVLPGDAPADPRPGQVPALKSSMGSRTGGWCKTQPASRELSAPSGRNGHVGHPWADPWPRCRRAARHNLPAAGVGDAPGKLKIQTSVHEMRRPVHLLVLVYFRSGHASPLR